MIGGAVVEEFDARDVHQFCLARAEHRQWTALWVETELRGRLPGESGFYDLAPEAPTGLPRFLLREFHGAARPRPLRPVKALSF